MTERLMAPELQTDHAVVARAPVRISFGGGGTDLAAYYERHGGFVLSTAITRYCYVAARPLEDGSVHIRSHDYGCVASAPAGTPLELVEPLVLPKAAVAWWRARGVVQRGVDLTLGAEVPPGSGLGSSSAMTVALVQALSALDGAALLPSEAAELACAIEIERLGKPIGKQDQYASAFGGLNTIEFRPDAVRVTPLPIDGSARDALTERLLLFGTGQTRDSGSILSGQRARVAAGGAVVAGLHQIKRLAFAMSEALVRGDLDAFGLLLHRSWCEKRALAGNISSAAIDGWYAAAQAAGALGGKIAGAGGGGFLLLYVPPERQAAVRAALVERGLRELAFGLDGQGAQALPRCAAPWSPPEHHLAAGEQAAGAATRVSERPEGMGR